MTAGVLDNTVEILKLTLKSLARLITHLLRAVALGVGTLRPRARPAPHSQVDQTIESLAPSRVPQANSNTCCLAGQALEPEARATGKYHLPLQLFARCSLPKVPSPTNRHHGWAKKLNKLASVPLYPVKSNQITLYLIQEIRSS